MSFNPDHDDLNEWFFVSFIEEWKMYSAEKDKDALWNIAGACTKVGIDAWCLDNMDTACDYSIPERFAKAILNTLDLNGLAARMAEWKDNHTCDNCFLCMEDCECEEDEKEHEKGCDCCTHL